MNPLKTATNEIPEKPLTAWEPIPLELPLPQQPLSYEDPNHRKSDFKIIEINLV